MNPVSVIGMGMSLDDFTLKHLTMIKNADVVVGGKRHLESMNDAGLLSDIVETRIISGEIKGLVTYIREALSRKQTVVTIASGDPLYFGIGTTLIKHFGRENVIIYPNITSVGAAFSKIKENWQDAAVLSLHGKDKPADFKNTLSGNDKIAVFTDPVKNPSWLAEKLIDAGYSDFKLCILEQIGSDNEKVDWYQPEEALNKTFSEPNIVILKREKSTPPQNDKPLRLGAPDDYFQHQNGLITKSEVRAVTISKLDLKDDSVFWDLGAGSGSVSIEASLFIKNGQIIAVEKEEKRVQDIEANKKRFNVQNLDIIHRELPDALEDLKRPDRVFIGGGGRNLETIIKQASQSMKNDGVIVVNTVILKNIETAITCLKNEGFKTEIVQVNVSFSHDMPWGEMLKSHNPVWIIKGKR